MKSSDPTTLSKAKIKMIRSLHRKKGRDESGLFIVEGEKVIEEAHLSNIELVELYKRVEIGAEKMGRISQSATPPPALAVAKIPSIKELDELNPDSLYLALDKINDPGNLGTIIRVAEWFGVEALLLSEGSVDPYNHKVVQSAMGSLFRVSIYFRELEEVIKEAKEVNLVSYAAELSGESLYSQKLTKGGLIVMGSESHGISPSLLSQIERRLHIPTFAPSSQVDSLNVAVATAIICAEFRRSSL